MQVGSVYAKLSAKIDDWQAKFKSAGNSLVDLEKTGSGAINRLNSTQQRYIDRIRDLENRQDTLRKRQDLVNQSTEIGKIRYQEIQNRIDNYGNSITTTKLRLQEYEAKTKSAGNQNGIFARTFESLKNTAVSVGTGILNSLRRIGEYAFGILVANQIQKIINKGQELLTRGFFSAQGIQDTRGGFEAMLGSAEKAGDLMVKLSEYNKKTPFTLPQLQEQASNLFAMGVEVENLIPTLDVLGKISRGNAMRLGNLTLAYGQVRTATKLTGAELRQFTENGVPLLELLAQQSGKTTRQIRKDMEDGFGPTFQEVDRALRSTTAEGGRFFNYFEKNQNNLSFVTSNIADGFDKMVRKIVGVSEEGNISSGGLFDRIVKSAQRTLDWMTANGDEIGAKIGDAVVGAIEAFERFTNDGLPKIVKFLGEVKVGFDNFSNWYNENKGLVDNFITALAGLATGFALVSGALTIAGIAMAILATPFLAVYLAVGAVIAIGFLLWKNWDWLSQQAGMIWDSIVNNVMNAVNSAINWVVNSFNSLVGFFVMIWAWLTVSPWEWALRLAYLAGFVVGLFVRGFIFLGATVWSILSWVGMTAYNIFMGIMQWGVTAMYNIVVFILGIPAQIGGFFIWLLQIGMSTFLAVQQWGNDRMLETVNFILSIPTRIYQAWEGIKQGAKDTWESAKRWAGEAKDNIVNTIMNLPQSLSQAWENIKKGAKDGFDGAVNAGNNMLEQIKKIDLAQAGKDMVQGLINGVSAKAQDALNAAKSLGDKFSQGFRDAMGIKSPSRVMMEMGDYTVQGLLKGVEDKQGEVKKSSENMAGNITGTAPSPSPQGNVSNSSSISQNNVFNISGGQNPQGIVQEVVRYLAKTNNLAKSGVGQSI